MSYSARYCAGHVSTLRLLVDGGGDGYMVAGDRLDDAIDVDVPVLDEDGVLVLGAAGDGAGEVDAGDVRLHGALVVGRLLAVAAELDADHLAQRHVVLVA